MVGRSPGIGQFGGSPLPRLQVQRGPNDVEEGEGDEPQILEELRGRPVEEEPNAEPEPGRDEQRRGVMPQPGEIKGYFDAEVFANVADRLGVKHFRHPGFLQLFQRRIFVHRKHLLQESGAQTFGHDGFAFAELDLAHFVAFVGFDAVEEVEEDLLPLFAAQKRLRIFNPVKVRRL